MTPAELETYTTEELLFMTCVWPSLINIDFTTFMFIPCIMSNKSLLNSNIYANK
jgi:hypothetical protein